MLLFIPLLHRDLFYFSLLNHFASYYQVPFLNNHTSYLGMCHLGIHICPIQRYTYFILFHLYSYVFVSHLNLQYLLIFIPLHHVLLSHFTQYNYFGFYHQIPHLHNPPSKPRMYHLGICLSPLTRYTDFFCLVYIHMPVYHILIFSLC